MLVCSSTICYYMAAQSAICLMALREAQTHRTLGSNSKGLAILYFWVIDTVTFMK